MDKIAVAKWTIGLTAKIGVASIVGGIVANNVGADTTFQKVTVYVGSFVLADMLQDKTQEHVDEKVDAAVQWLAGLQDDQKLDNEYKSNR